MKKLKLLLAFCALLLGWSNASAGTDVTSTYLTNADFSSGTPIDNNVCTYGKDMASNSTTYYGAQTIDGWTNASVGETDSGYANSKLAGALFAYGSTPWLAGSGTTAPATDPNEKSGNAAGLCAVWGGSIQYTQNVTLPSGSYTVKFDVYNATTGSGNSSGVITSSLFGFVEDGGTTHYAPNNTLAIGQWSTIAVTFELAAETSGKISMGYVGPSGNAAMPHLFVDNVKIISNEVFEDCTDKVNKTGWTGAGDGYQGGTINTARQYGDKSVGRHIYQTVSGLDNGMYEVALYSISQKEWNGTLTADAGNVAYVFAEGSEEIKEWINARARNSYPGDDNIGIYTISGVKVTNGTLTLGMGLAQADLTEWHHIQIKSLIRTADLDDLSSYIDLYNSVKATAEAFTEASMWSADWTTLQTAISNNTLNLDDSGLSKDDLKSAISNLTAANTAATAAVAAKTTYDDAVSTINGGTNVDLTSFIVNPSFESDFDGWTNTGGMAIQGNDSFGKTGSKYAEFWQPNGTKGVSQTVGALPAGVYTLSLRALARGVTSAKLFANSDEQAITIEDKQNEYNLTFEIADKASINIGFEGVGTGAGSSWLALDNFRLTYVGTINDLTYTKATGKMGTDKSAAQDGAETTFLANKTLANYNALIAAISEAEASVANYAALKAAIDKANAVKTANNFVTAAAATAFQSAITTATNGWTDVTFTDAQCTTQITTLGTGVSGWHANATGAAGVYMTSTWGKTYTDSENPGNWWDAPYINTWSTEGDNDGSGFSVPFFEYYTGDKENLAANTFTATLTGLDNGVYEVELWARAQRRSDADFNSDNSMITMSVNGGDAVSIMSDTEHTVGTGGSVMRLGHYTATGIVTDGTLTLSIDVKLGANVHWLSWRDVTYTKVAPANVSATIGSTGWTTFASPYALDLSNMTASTGSVAAYYASATSDKSVTVLTTESSAVQAGEGIMLKGTAGATITIPVVASGSAISGNLLVGCPTATTITSETTNYAAIYVLGGDVAEFQNVKNWIDGGNTVSIPAGKAYLDATSSNGARALRISFADITGVENVEAAAEAKAQEGKFVENGKIVIVKNGKKYNANGQQVK